MNQDLRAILELKDGAEQKESSAISCSVRKRGKRIKRCLRVLCWLLGLQAVGTALSIFCAIYAGSAPSDYLTDRLRDGADVFTATVGKGGGVKVRVGPLRAGLFFNHDRAGLRGGEFYRSIPKNYVTSSDFFTWTYPLDLDLILFSHEGFLTGRSERHKSATFRKKKFASESAFVLSWCEERYRSPYYYTQIETAFGIGGTIRLGFNPGELLDFIVGWLKIDLYKDDLGRRT